MPATIEQPLALRAMCITLAGRVQGIGLRPAVARWAHELHLAGSVSNTPRGVQILVEGPASTLERFVQGLRDRLPPTAQVEEMESTSVLPQGLTVFTIAPGADAGRLAARVPPDQVVCSACLADTQSANRRAAYAFTSCADCGPRYSIIEAMPYERAQTSMAAFALCAACRGEYESPADRRFHAQTTACPRCGPRLWCGDGSGKVVASADGAMLAAASAIGSGQIVAVRGLGGYQLVVDATSPPAVERLRQRKRRHGKPLAVMAGSLEEARRLAQLSVAEQELLTSPAGPIVVAAARAGSPVAAAVHPGLDTIGVMLPTTPLHWLLLRACRRPLVVTSGNLEGEPLAYWQEEALRQLHGVADLWLEHDRPIRRPIDDSVVRVIADRPATVRLARGYAPLPLRLEARQPTLAMGGQQKAALALTNGTQAVLGPHIGDLDTLASRERLLEQVAALTELYAVRPERSATDQHPDYFATQWALAKFGTTETVQHHHAHIVVGMLEHGWLDHEVLGVAFDGTGYGADGTIWGGEFLRATATGFRRVAHLRPFRLPGGERAAREPWRVAVSLVKQAVGADEASRLAFPPTASLSPEGRGGDSCDCARLLPIIRSPRFSPLTSSAGRLFDGVAALALGVSHCQFEGQAAMMLEAACTTDEQGSYPMPISAGQPREVDWRPLIAAALRDRAAGVEPGIIAMRFHRGLAMAVASLCRAYAPLPIVLGGGVFQNRALVELIVEELAGSGQPLGLPGLIPVNDGGLAAGQLAVATARRSQKLRRRQKR
jgi:hydrogenase maturation protein HypF